MVEKDIEIICKKYKIKNYTINADGSIDVTEDVYLNSGGLVKIPLKFNYVSDNFHCTGNKLISLEGCPKEVGGSFYCRSNGLTSLEFSPEKVDGDFDCSDNKLTNLEFGPNQVGRNFYCDDNYLTSLEFSPKQVGGYFDCHDNELTNLYGISDNIGNLLFCEKNPIGSIFNEVDIDFIRAFNAYKVVKGNTVILKRLKYVMELFEKPIDLEKIKKHYTIIK